MAEYRIKDFRTEIKGIEYPKVEVIFLRQNLPTDDNKTFILIFIFENYMRSLWYNPETKEFILHPVYSSAQFLVSFLHGYFEVFQVVQIHQVSFERILYILERQLVNYHRQQINIEALISDGRLLEALQIELKVLHGSELPSEARAGTRDAWQMGTSEEALGHIVASILLECKHDMTAGMRIYAQEHGVVLE